MKLLNLDSNVILNILHIQTKGFETADCADVNVTINIERFLKKLWRGDCDKIETKTGWYCKKSMYTFESVLQMTIRKSLQK